MAAECRVDAGRLGLRLPGERLEGGEVEAGKALMEEGLGLIGCHRRNRERRHGWATFLACM